MLIVLFTGLLDVSEVQYVTLYFEVFILLRESVHRPTVGSWRCFRSRTVAQPVVTLDFSIPVDYLDARFFLPMYLKGANELIDLAIFRRFLLSKFADMQTFAGESMTAEGGMAFGYYKDGAHNPTFAYISKALEAEKVRQF